MHFDPIKMVKHENALPKERTDSKFLLRPIFSSSPALQYLFVIVVLTALTLGGFLFDPLIGAHSTAFIFLLAVVALAMIVGRGPTLLAATMSALIWDYYFLPPVRVFSLNHFEDGMLLDLYFVVAYVLGQLTRRIWSQEQVERERQERATALLLLTRDLTEASDLEQMLENASRHLDHAFKTKTAILLPDHAQGLKRQPYPAGAFTVDEQDRAMALQVLVQGTWSKSVNNIFFLPLLANKEIHGVLGLKFAQLEPKGPLWDYLEDFNRQIALALDRHRLREASESAKIFAESERLSKTMLNSISHEIRTPIAAIKSAAGNLVEFKEAPLSASQQTMIAEIQEATDRLDRLVGNVLEITRLESGQVKPKLNLYDVRDLIQVAVKETKKELSRHQVAIIVAPGLPLVQMDFVLTQQALRNLLSNAAFHTPPGTLVEISAQVAGDALVLTVADDGPGIPPESIARIFDKFYRDPSALAGGIGIGLSVVSGFVTAQDGQIEAENRAGGGASFTIRLPLNKTSSIIHP